MSTVYLHMGMHKTGTSALQHLLGQNNEVLQKHGIIYPDLGIRYDGVGAFRNAHFLAVPYINGQGEKVLEKPSKEYDGALEQLEELGKTYETIILSDESIWLNFWLRIDFYKKVKEDFEKRNLQIKIILYLRRQDQWFESFWAQQVKERDERSFAQFIAEKKAGYPLDYYKALNKIAEVFGRDALIIRVYEKGQFEGEERSLFSDFLGVVGMKLSDGFELEKEIYNTSLVGNYLEMKRVLNCVPEFRSGYHPIIKQMRSLQEQDEFGSRKVSYFQPQEQAAFMAEYEEANQKVAKEFLGRADGVLFRQSNKDSESINENELLRNVILVYGSMIDQLIKENNELKTNLRNLREDVIWYRMKRKARHLLGKDQPKE